MREIGETLKIIAPKYRQILKDTEPYLLTFPGNLPEYELKPLGLHIPKSNVLSCIDPANQLFFDSLQTLDRLSFGPVGMPMEKWVFYDCGEMPGGIFGFAIHANNLHPAVLNQYGYDYSYKGLVPVSMYIAIPMAAKGCWFGHNLCSANSFLGEKYDFSGLALATKAFGVRTLGITDCYGATQWESGALNIHTQLSDMEIISAYTPAHSFSKTMTYKSNYTKEGLLNAMSGNVRRAVEYDLLVDVTDDCFFMDLQDKIEKGERYSVMGRPHYDEGRMFLPIKKVVSSS